MTNSYKKVCYSMDYTRELAKRFAELAKDGCFVNLFGDIGAGKTAFVRIPCRQRFLLILKNVRLH